MNKIVKILFIDYHLSLSLFPLVLAWTVFGPQKVSHHMLNNCKINNHLGRGLALFAASPWFIGMSTRNEIAQT
jgi:hypothetical protein